MPVESRVPPLPPEQWTDEARTMFTIFEGPEAYETGSKSNVLLTLARHPKLGTSFFKYSGRLLVSSKLDAALREIVILRVAWLYRSPYEWAQHVEMSLIGRGFSAAEIDSYRKGGSYAGDNAGLLTPEHVEAVKRGADDPIWTPLQASAIRAVDQLKDTGHIADDTWAVLAERLEEQHLIELIFFIGTYALLAWAFNAFATPPEEGHAKWAQDIPAVHQQ